MRVLNRDDVRALLPMAACIETMAQVMRASARGQAVQPLRGTIPIPGRSGILGWMPGAIGDPDVFGAKIVSVFLENFGTRFQSHQGGVLLFETGNGAPVALVHAGEITAIRTAAASALATRTLANRNAGDLAILGYGEQAGAHLAAMREVRTLRRVRVWGRSPDRARAFADREGARHGLAVEVAPGAEAAVRGADLICTVTGAAEPILRGTWIAAGAHLNVVGSSVASAREIDSEAVARSRLFVDQKAATAAHGGDYCTALQEGAIGESHIVAEIGEVLTGAVEGRRSADEITLYKSVGVVAEDLAAAHYVYERALETDRGVDVPF